nr:hypothetical protein [Tanacetum cinerariifolium]
MNEDTPVGVSYVVKEGVTPSMVDMTSEMEKQSTLDNNSVLEYFPPLSKPVTTDANAPGKSSYANVTGIPSRKKLKFCTLFTPRDNEIDVVVPVEFIRAIYDRFANTAYGFFLGKGVAYPVIVNYVRNTWGKYGLVRFMFSSSTGLFSFQFSFMYGLDAMLENGPCILVTAFNNDGLSAIATKLDTPVMLDSYTADMCMQSWLRSSYARVIIELHADVELKDNIVMAMPKIKEVGYYTCNIRVDYELKPFMCMCCKVFGYVNEECTKNINVGTTKTLKKTSQTPKGFLVRQKIGFKPKQVFQPVSKKSTTNTHGKMNNPESTKEVSKSNPFEVLTSVDNDVDLGTYGGIANSADKGTNNVSSSNTPIGEKIDKIERQICEGKLRILTSGKDESDKGYDTNSLLEQWMDFYLDNDDYDPYDDDMYDNHDMS